MRLNGIKEPNYSSKVSYEIFKALGKIYERRYQKDVQESLDVLNPILKMVDSVFLELLKNQEKMKKSVRNSFMLAYAESTYLDSLHKKEGVELEKSLDILTKFSTSSFISMPKFLLDTAETIKTSGLFDTGNESYSDILYTLGAAKRKIERELDWTMCSFDKSSFPLIRKSEIQNSPNSINQKSLTSSKYHPEITALAEHITKNLKNSINNQEWKNKQDLSLLLKNSSNKDDTFYLDTKSVPDANNLDKVLDIPFYCKSEKITAKKLAKKMNVQPRMAMYYLDAAEMLGLIKKSSNYYISTKLVDKIGTYSEDDRKDIIDKLIKDLPVVKAFFLYLKSESKTQFTTKDIAKFLEYSTDLSSSTARRRASTISSWLKKQKIVKNRNESFYIKDDESQTRLNEFING